jgi:hypothetical protein
VNEQSAVEGAPSRFSAYDLDHDEPPRAPGDGRRLAGVAIGLAICGIVLPFICSIAALVVAGIAKKRLKAVPDTQRHRSMANAAQAFAIIDMIGYATIITLYLRYLNG